MAVSVYVPVVSGKTSLSDGLRRSSKGKGCAAIGGILAAVVCSARHDVGAVPVASAYRPSDVR
jgi:hypothetical protein